MLLINALLMFNEPFFQICAVGKVKLIYDLNFNRKIFITFKIFNFFLRLKNRVCLYVFRPLNFHRVNAETERFTGENPGF